MSRSTRRYRYLLIHWCNQFVSYCTYAVAYCLQVYIVTPVNLTNASVERVSKCRLFNYIGYWNLNSNLQYVSSSFVTCTITRGPLKMCDGRSVAQYYALLYWRSTVRPSSAQVRERSCHRGQILRIQFGLCLLRFVHLPLLISGGLSNFYIFSLFEQQWLKRCNMLQFRCWTCSWLLLWTTLTTSHVIHLSWVPTTWTNLSVSGQNTIRMQRKLWVQKWLQLNYIYIMLFRFYAAGKFSIRKCLTCLKTWILRSALETSVHIGSHTKNLYEWTCQWIQTEKSNLPPLFSLWFVKISA